jgi:glutamine amidotransferase-like uncharacterized protein
VKSWLAILCVVVLSACTKQEAPEILLFNGSGTSPNDVKAVEVVLRARHLGYATVNSDELNGMSEGRLGSYRLLIIPGGNYITIGNGLTKDAVDKVREAVRSGTNYLGICAGGILAGSNGLDLTSGVKFGFYAVVNQGVHKTMVIVDGAEMSPIEHYWEDGPEFSGWGEVVGRYPDKTPAVVQGLCGKGWVVLCGVHPEAPESWRRGMTSVPADDANAYAGTLIDAALRGTRLPRF